MSVSALGTLMAGQVIAPLGSAFDLLTAQAGLIGECLGGERTLLVDRHAWSRYFPPHLAESELTRLIAPERFDAALHVSATEVARYGVRFPGDDNVSTTYGLMDLVQEAVRDENVGLYALPLRESTPSPFQGGYVPHIGRERDLVRPILERLSEPQPEGTQWASGAASQLMLDFLDQIRSAGGTLDLRGRKFVLLGGSADYAMTRLLLEAGARVLVIGIKDGRYDRLVNEASQYPGVLAYVPEGTNLLTQPHRVAATIAKFSGGDDIYLGDYLYKPKDQMRLAMVRYALATALAPMIVAYFGPRTPTVPYELADDVIQRAEKNFTNRGPWRSALNKLFTWNRMMGPLPLVAFNQGLVQRTGAAVTVSSVTGQGPDYNAGGRERSFLADLFTSLGFPLDEHLLWGGLVVKEARSVTVVTPVAPVAMTSGMKGNPIIDAALGQAWREGVGVFGSVPEARDTVGLMILAGLFCDTSPYLAARAGDYKTPHARARAMAQISFDGGLASTGFTVEGQMLGLVLADWLSGGSRRPNRKRRWMTLTGGGRFQSFAEIEEAQS